MGAAAARTVSRFGYLSHGWTAVAWWVRGGCELHARDRQRRAPSSNGSSRLGVTTAVQPRRDIPDAEASITAARDFLRRRCDRASCVRGEPRRSTPRRTPGARLGDRIACGTRRPARRFRLHVLRREVSTGCASCSDLSASCRARPTNRARRTRTRSRRREVLAGGHRRRARFVHAADRDYSVFLTPDAERIVACISVPAG